MAVTGIDHVQVAAPPGCEERRAGSTATCSASRSCRSPRRCARGAAAGSARARRSCTSASRSPSRRRARRIRASSTRDLERLRGRLGAAGVAWEDDARACGGVDRLYVHDPFGNRLEVRQSIRSTYGYAPACGVLRGRRAAELLPGGRAAGSDPAGGEPPDPGAREAARHEAPRPLGPARRADGGGDAPLPRRPADAGARGAGGRGGRRTREGTSSRAASRSARRRGPAASSSRTCCASSRRCTRRCTSSSGCSTRARSSSGSPRASSSSASSARRAATAASRSSRSSTTRSCSRARRGIAFAGRTIALEELRGAGLIVMQEGAGVRQLIEDELARAGTRLRDLDVRLELGLQESVTSAVRGGYGVTFISRSLDRVRPRRGHARGGSRRGARAPARDLARPRGRPVARRGPPAHSSTSRASGCRDRPLVARRAAGSARGARASSGLSCSRRRDGTTVAGAVRSRSLERAAHAAHRRSRRRGRDPRRRRRLRDRHGEERVVADGARARLRADDLLGRRVDGGYGIRDAGPPDGGRRRGREPGRDRLRRRADARAAAGGDGRHGAQRARPLRRGALRAEAGASGATSWRSTARS